METNKENVMDNSREFVSTTFDHSMKNETSVYLKNCVRQRTDDEHLFLIWLEDTKKCQLLEQVLVRTGIQMQICKSGDECYNCLNEWHTGKVSLILDGSLCETLIAIVHSFIQLESIYLICQDDVEVTKLEYLNEMSDKIKYTMVDVHPVCTELRRLENVIHDFTTLSPEMNESNNDQEVSFMFAGLLRDVFLSIDPDDEEKREFENWCQDEYANNEPILAQLREFISSYRAEDAAVWYTRPIFLFGLLNRTLRSQNMLMILHFRFFIRDLYRQLQWLHTDFQASLSAPITVYRGQGMAHNDFEKLIKNNVGSLLSITTFWSTSRNTNVADIFVELDPLKVAILFEITLDISIHDIPFAEISHLSAVPHEEEVLVPMGSVFRITSVEQLPSNGIWKVILQLTNDDDPDLRYLTEHTHKEMEQMTPWYKLGYLLIHMGDFDTAMTLHESILAVTPPDEKKGLGDLFHQMALIHEKKDNFDMAYSFYCQSLEFYKDALPPDDPRIALAYTGIGYMLQEQGHVDLALKHFEQALTIDLCAPKRNYQVIAERLSNIGMALLYQQKLAEGLAKFEEALEMQLKHLPPTHSGLALTYNNIATVYAARKDFATALSYIEKTLFIEEKSHPAKHPSVAAAHYSIAFVLMGLKRYCEALEHTQKALAIANETFPNDHPRIIEYREQLGTLVALQASKENTQ